MNRFFRAVLAPVAVLATAACVDLDVTNPNQPDVGRVLSTPEDVVSVASGAIYRWYMGTTHYEPTALLGVSGDGVTGNYGNFAMRFNNTQPRRAFNNNSAATNDHPAVRRPWVNYYGAIGAANDAQSALAAGLELPGGTDGEEQVRSAILFTLANAHTSLGLMFDKAFIVTQPVTGTLPVLEPYDVVLDSAMALWDRLIDITDNKDWEWPLGWFPNHDEDMTSDNINRIANTMAARTLVLGARTGAQRTTTDWAAVLAYAERGITGGLVAGEFDVGVTDDYNVWWDFSKNVLNDDGWVRVDQRIINLMDPDIPANFSGMGNQPVTTPNDNRLGTANLSAYVVNEADPTDSTRACDFDPVDPACVDGLDDVDFLELRSVIGDPARGIYMQSSFTHNRYRNSSFAVEAIVNIGRKVPYVLAAENDLMIAEALVETGGNLTRAASLVNKTREIRGGLAPVAASALALRAAIEYERYIELMNTGFTILWDRRRFETLQPLSPRHFPVPAAELETLALPIYTFGGPTNPDM